MNAKSMPWQRQMRTPYIHLENAQQQNLRCYLYRPGERC